MPSISSESALKKPKVYESRRIQLTSPILHIGSEIPKLNPFEYVATDKQIYLPVQESLAKALKKRGGRFLDDYITTLEERRPITKLLEQAFGLDWQDVRDEEGNPIFPKHTIGKRWTDQKITDLRPMIRNGMGQLFIPGSSIKGAIRTAIAYHFLKYPDRYQVPQQNRISEIEKTLIEKLGPLNQHQHKFFDDNLFMKSLFSDFSLIYQGRASQFKKNADSSSNTDFLRTLKVSDTDPILGKKVTNKQGKSIPLNLSVVVEAIVSSKFSNHLAKYKASIYVEMVRNVHTEFTLTLDTEMLNWFQRDRGIRLPFQTLDELLEICQEFTQEQWDYEHDYWDNIEDNFKAADRNLQFSHIREFYEPEKSPYQLRLGWGSGMTGTTVDLLFKDETRQKIRDLCGFKAPDFEAPKSRRTVVNPTGEIKWVPGWVKLKAV